MAKIQRFYDDTITAHSKAVPVGRFIIVEVTTNMKQIYRARVDAPKGSPNQPLSTEELIKKLEMYAPKHAENIGHLENMKNTNEFITYIAMGG